MGPRLRHGRLVWGRLVCENVFWAMGVGFKYFFILTFSIEFLPILCDFAALVVRGWNVQSLSSFWICLYLCSLYQSSVRIGFTNLSMSAGDPLLVTAPPNYSAERSLCFWASSRLLLEIWGWKLDKVIFYLSFFFISNFFCSCISLFLLKMSNSLISWGISWSDKKMSPF